MPMNRRQFLTGLCGAPGVVRAATAKRPNIVLIMADDMGYSDLGCYGSEIATPNLDRLAAGGVRFTQFYNTARCCPTRSSLLTGLYPHQAGVGHMVSDRGYPAYQGYLNNRCVTIAEALAPAGYRTLMSGKWHVGEKRPHWPLDRGFQRYFGLISGGSNYFRLDPGRQMAFGNKPFTPPEKFYMTDAFTDYALRFLDEQKGSQVPFFLYLAYTSPHWPLHAWPEDIARYRGRYRIGWDELRLRRHRRMIEMGLVDRRWPLTPRDGSAPAWKDVKDPDMRDLRMAVYAAQIDRMDQNIGRVLAKLREMGVENNTLVLFLADNGGCAEEIERGKAGALPGTPDSFTSYGLPWANASNTPFRLYKHWVHEGGIATPLITYWPGVVPKPGSLTHQPGHIIDIMATCLDVAGAAYPSNVTPLEGRTLMPIFEGRKRRPHEALFWEHEGNRAVRQGKWKLVSRYPGTWELYDLERDRTEIRDLAAREPRRVQEMTEIYRQWAERCGVVDWSKFRKSGG
ncbi:MAG: arylsulfatase [Bryobacteraceae bacterium]